MSADRDFRFRFGRSLERVPAKDLEAMFQQLDGLTAQVKAERRRIADELARRQARES